MAIGTMTIVETMQLPKGAMLYKVSFAGDSDYPTNGTLKAAVETALELAIDTAVTAATDKNVRGHKNISVVEAIPGDCGQYVPSWSGTALLVRDGGHATWDQPAAKTDLKATTFNVGFICE